MTGSFRLYAGVAVLASVVIVLTVVGSRAGAPGDGFQWPPDYTVNRIAVVGSDARIRTYSPDGTGELLITPDDGVFTWPTWSPNGRDIAYSRVTRDAQGQQFIALDSYDRISQEYSVVHQGDPGFAGLLAEGVVHYPLWSPDSKKLAFVVVTQNRGLSLFLSDRTTDDEPRFLLDSGPLWMSWSSDSGHLAVHRGGQHFLVQMDDDPKAKSLWLEPSDGYRVPAWRPRARCDRRIQPRGNTRARCVHCPRLAGRQQGQHKGSRRGRAEHRIPLVERRLPLGRCGRCPTRAIRQDSRAGIPRTQDPGRCLFPGDGAGRSERAGILLVA